MGNFTVECKNQIKDNGEFSLFTHQINFKNVIRKSGYQLFGKIVRKIWEKNYTFRCC